jgi:hypothetical protein
MIEKREALFAASSAVFLTSYYYISVIDNTGRYISSTPQKLQAL